MQQTRLTRDENSSGGNVNGTEHSFQETYKHDERERHEQRDMLRNERDNLRKRDVGQNHIQK